MLSKIRHPGRAVAAVLGAILAVAALGTSQALSPVPAVAQAAAGETVRIDNFTFNPGAITVKAGATVTWVNGDDIPHTVRAVDGSFKSKVLDSGEKFSFTFAKPGEFAYFCSLHPHMTGKVIVKA
jgi:plastocyanin